MEMHLFSEFVIFFFFLSPPPPPPTPPPPPVLWAIILSLKGKCTNTNLFNLSNIPWNFTEFSKSLSLHSPAGEGREEEGEREAVLLEGKEGALEDGRK